MGSGRRWTVRLAAASAGAVLLVEILEIALWPLPFGSLYLLSIAGAIAVPAAGAWLVARGDERGIAVLVAGGLIAIPHLSYDLIQLIWWTEPITAIELALAVLRVAGSAALLASGALAWHHREREDWHLTSRRPWAYAAVALATFAVGQLWPSRMLVPPRALTDVPFLLQVLAIGIIFIAVARLPRRLAAAALLAAVAPVLATALFDLGQMLAFGGALRDISGVLDVIGRIVLVAIAVHWWRAERPDSVTEPEPEPETT